MNRRSLYPLALCLILCVLSLWSYTCAAEAKVWRAEFGCLLLVWAPLVLSYRWFRFSAVSYTVVFAWCVLQIIGARYTFELVPFDAVTQLFGFERNHYDRVAHFTIGVSSMLIAELCWRRRWVCSRTMAAFVGVIFIMAVANFWELVEWIYAVVDGGEAGAAFLGSQGDVWDAQKDMLMDTLGSLLGVALFALTFRRRGA